MVFNKIDNYEPEIIEEDDLMVEKSYQHYTLEEWKKTWMQREGDNVLFISATEKENIEEFRKKVYEAARKIHVKRFPYNNFLYPEYEADIEEEELEE
jgi:GTP-binding protein HflX